ncbi:MAG TPA: Gfo/Idh/MocA family oxidoreductase [Opitutaceae bacterium]|nr:Gfo/Idh/MocA family oxidoreductase [Opitutaceae bacterium]
MTSSPIGFGIIGIGMIADFHAKALAEVKGARLIGAVGRSADKVRDYTERNGVPFWTTDVNALLARDDIQAVCITTPSGAHLDPALAAIRAGKHVVVEKPLEITVERIDQILNEADKAGVRVAAIFQSRFGEGARKVKAAAEAGRFGRLVLCSAYVKWHRKAEYYRDSWHGTLALDGGGALMNQGIHAVDLLQWLVGLPAEVTGFKTRCVHTSIEVEDTVCASLRFPHGALGAIEASTALYPGWQRRIEICGENGSVALEDDRITRWDFREPQPGDAEILAAKQDDTMRTGSSAPNQISHQGHRLQIQDLVNALREHRPLAIDGREGRRAVALIRGIYMSAERGTPVKL